MHCFVLFDFLFELLSEYTVIEGVGRACSIAIGFLQPARCLMFVQLLLKNFQPGLKLCVEEGECFDLLAIASQVLIFPIDILLRKADHFVERH